MIDDGTVSLICELSTTRLPKDDLVKIIEINRNCWVKLSVRKLDHWPTTTWQKLRTNKQNSSTDRFSAEDHFKSAEISRDFKGISILKEHYKLQFSGVFLRTLLFCHLIILDFCSPAKLDWGPLLPWTGLWQRCSSLSPDDYWSSSFLGKHTANSCNDMDLHNYHSYLFLMAILKEVKHYLFPNHKIRHKVGNIYH